MRTNRNFVNTLLRRRNEISMFLEKLKYVFEKT